MLAKRGSLLSTHEDTFKLAGLPRVYHVALGGADAKDRGTAQKPFATIQLGIDHLLAGDTERIAPGLHIMGRYDQPKAGGWSPRCLQLVSQHG